MNITNSIAKSIGKKYEKIINDNSSIQFYANSNIEKYLWRDSSQERYSNMFENKKFDTRKELIEFIKPILDGIYSR